MNEIDVVVIGGGPAGLAAALECKRLGVDNVLLLERDERLGGILQQCIHNGFGLHRFGEELTGPEYAHRFIDKVLEQKIDCRLNTTVLSIDEDKTIYAVNPNQGVFKIKAKSIILAMGCRERTSGAIKIPGMRPSGVYTAGMAQRMVNLEGYLPGKELVILGSGDIGLIMARRMTLEGANVKMVCELMPYSTGLARNVHQCLNDFDIPLRLRHTVVKIHGENRINGVTIAKVDSENKPIVGTEEFVSCDTLLLSVGLIPENELSTSAGLLLDSRTKGAIVDGNRETSIDGVFACGNVLHVHDLVDYVSEEAEIAARGAVEYIKHGKNHADCIELKPVQGLLYVVPQKVTKNKSQEIYFRSDNIYDKPKLMIENENREVLFEKSFIKLLPGIMQRLELPKEVTSSNCKVLKLCIKA